MKIKVTLILIIVFVIGAVWHAVRIIPYHFYMTAIREGVNSEYIKLNTTPKSMMRGSLQSSDVHIDDGNEYFQTLWKDFHFSNFIVPFPVHHHQIQIIPIIKERNNQRPMVGAKYVDTNGQEIFSFIEGPTFSLKINMDKEKIFSFPVIRQVVLQKKWDEIWQDFFTYDIDLPESLGLLPWSKDSILEIPYEKLAYGLFLTHMRHQYLADIKVEELQFVQDKKMGVIISGDIDERFNSQIIWIFSNGTVYPLYLRLNRGEPLSKILKDRFISKLKFAPAAQDSAIKIYADYKMLPYRSRISQEGMVYLYSCFSHNPDQKDFLKEMIHFLERGRDNFGYLRPLYDYALKKFGTTLSSRLDKIEDAQSRLERKISEEGQKEILEAKEQKITSPEENFQSQEDKMQFYLKRAKESGINSDESDSRIYK